MKKGVYKKRGCLKNLMKERVLFVFLLFFNSAFCEVISVGNYNFDISQKSITIPLTINSNSEFAGFQINLSFDPKVLAINNVRVGEFVSSFNVLNNKGPGFLRIAGFSSNLQGISGSGVIAYIDFSLLSQGVSNLILSGKVSNKEGKSIPFSFLSGKIEVTGKEENQTQKNKDEKNETKPKETSNVPSFLSEKRDVIQTTGISNLPASFTETKEINQPIPQNPYPVPNFNYSNPDYSSKASSSKTSLPFYEDPSAKENCILFVISEYGNPKPGNGIFTYKKGQKIECSVEKEVISGNEKYLCEGYEGYGSIDNGEGNYISFTITTDTKIKWKWKKIENREEK